MLAEAADVAAELGLSDESDLSDQQTARIPSLLVKASYLFRQAAGRQFTEDTYTHRLQVVGGRVRLLETPVTSVTDVVDDCGNTVTYTRNGSWLNVAGHHHNPNNSFGCYHPEGSGSGWFVTATYTGGEIPDVITVAVAQLVARYLSVDPAVKAGAKSVDSTAGPFSTRIQYADWATETVSLTEDDMCLAASFRYPTTALIVHRP